MDIGGFQEFTLIDYPGKIACVIFTQGCNFRCPFCHNGGLIPIRVTPSGKRAERVTEKGGNKNVGDAIQNKKAYTDTSTQDAQPDIPLTVTLDEHWVIDFLISRMRKLDAVVITGGEPTIQPDLVDFCDMLKQLGYLVKLDTNGSNPQVVRELIERNLIDSFAMDIKAPWNGYRRLTRFEHPVHRIIQSMHMIAQSGKEHQFRTTFVEDLLTDEDIEEIGAIIPKGSPWTVQKYNPETACDSRLRQHIVPQDLIIDPFAPGAG